MNRKGQTLVEFVIILPVFLIILFYIIDFGRIIYSKNKLENNLNDAVFLVKNGNDTTDFVKSIGNHVVLSIDNSNSYKKIILSENIDLIAPGFNLILSNPYEISVSRVVYDETE